MKNCQFDNCKFESCQFLSLNEALYKKYNVYKAHKDDKNQGFVQDISFYNSIMSNCEFRYTKIENLDFIKCTFKNILFSDVHIDGNLIFDSVKGFGTVKANDKVIFSTYSNEYVYKERVGLFDKLFCWSSIKFLSDLPIPKIGFGIIFLMGFILPLYNYIVLKFCNAFVNYSDLDFAKCTSFVFNFEKVEFEKYFTIGVLLFFLLTSILHKSLEPNLLREYNVARWQRELRKSRIEWNFLNTDKRFFVILVMVLYALEIIYLFSYYIYKIIL